jgi:hypothetical protein
MMYLMYVGVMSIIIRQHNARIGTIGGILVAVRTTGTFQSAMMVGVYAPR